MNKIIRVSLIAAFLFLPFSEEITAQNSQISDKKYTYESVPGDPLNARIYKLSNGFTVYMTVYKNAPRIQTYIAVRAGSKNDPTDATGLAHYLEHMVFKGSDQFGSLDFAKEKPLLDKIEQLYEGYRKTTDEAARTKIYRQIDSISGVASKFAIANEYDKMLAAIGAKGTNAYTWVEQTVYVNDIPSNQLATWLKIEKERFRNPIMRLFHTELEAVYEEKNRTLDDDADKLWDGILGGIFQKHTYGTQTTIGTIDHLKNPSLIKINNYFRTYYVPNNMALCISGDFDPDATIKLVDESFGKLVPKTVPVFNVPVEDPIKAPLVIEKIGPQAETMGLAFRFKGEGSKEADMVRLIDKILYNGTAGLMDLNLIQSQKVLGASSYAMILKDYSCHVFNADPKEGQSLEQTRDLVLEQIKNIKDGKFPDWLIPAIINDMKLSQTNGYEKNRVRADAFVDAFIKDMKWTDFVQQIDRLSKITKKEVMEFAANYYKDNYVVVYKRTGEDKNIQKVIKPSITPVEVNREAQSAFVKEIVNARSNEIEPVYLDYSRDIKNINLNSDVPLMYMENKENNIFKMYYILDMGSLHNKKLELAINYLQFLGTSKYTPEQLKEEFYKIGSSYSVFNSEDQVYVDLVGLTDNFEKGLELFESLLKDPQANEEALKNLVNDILKRRQDAKLSKQEILNNAMYNYGVYGPKSPYNNILSEEELRQVKSAELISILKELFSYKHRILYYGPMRDNRLVQVLNSQHKVPAALKEIPAPAQFQELEMEKTKVYIVNYDMKQAEIMMLSKGNLYASENAPEIALYNEYFGGGMSSVVFQEMRESKALAYSVYSNYRTPSRKEKSHYIMAYIGTQADKLPEAMSGMTTLINTMPESSPLFEASKNSVIQKIRTERITKSDVLFNYERAKKLGLDYDIRRKVFENVPKLTLANIKSFQEKYVKDKKYVILVLGNKENLDLKTLESYGEVKFLELRDVFGY